MGQSLITGVDINHRYIRAVVLKPGKNTCKLVCYHQVAIDDDILTDNDRLNYQEIVKNLKELRKALPLFSRKVCLSIPDNAIITKQLQLDSGLSEEESLFAIEQAFSQHSLIEVDDLYFDFIVLPNHDENNKHTYQVYATRKYDIDGLMAACSQAKLTPLLINPYSYNLSQLWRQAVDYYQQHNWLLIDFNGSHLSMYFESKVQGSVYHHLEVGDEKSTILDGLRSLYRHIQLLNIQPSGVWLTGESRLNPDRICESIPEAKFDCVFLNLPELVRFKTNHQVQTLGEYSRALSLALSGIKWLEQVYEL
ncbi:pilus assembly protein PilM [Vibrio hepatarius]|uniref:pilus assembly protein PilM n=1 Tax=Vibrio hepatarius TaxID=171383 RepID=UPI001C09AAE7|nr:pilus assembly protein PilM [Vibrio hepatarius]MBU2896957.1 pilus assembly protein PilM [Vibrio hepatarius]